MADKIISCPKCGAALNVGDGGGRKEMVITCPKCATPLRICFDADRNDPRTVLLNTPPCGDQAATLEYGSRTYRLEAGSNTVGRAASSSRATVQIDTDDRTMSRMHASIMVHTLGSGRLKAVLSYANDKADNPIFLNQDRLAPEDQLVLEAGDVIMMGHTKLKFNCKSINTL